MKKSKFYKAKMAVRKRRSLFIKGIFTAAIILFNCCMYSQLDTLIFEYTGAPQSWTVPSGVDEVAIVAAGAQGGSGPGEEGGFGFRVKGDLAVSPGDILHIYVGGKGTTATNGNLTGGGWNGGGDANGGYGSFSRGGGGGASDVRIGGISLGDRVIIGGGGGGSANDPYKGGNAGGDQGGNGVGGQAAGKGGSQSSGGSGSSSGCYSGELGVGGSSTSIGTCAGGGGGYYGGGSGSGGGGGSSYIGGVLNGEYLSGLRTGDGIVMIVLNQGTENDLCQNPLPIGCNETVFGNTENATPDNPPCRGLANTGGGLWYSFVGTGQDVTLSTCHPGTNYDTYLSVYAADCDEPICVASNDNSTGCFNTGKSELSFFAAAGGTYRILVDGLNGAEGDFQLTLTCGLPCENAEDFNCGETKFGSTQNALIDNSPICGSMSNGRGNWYIIEGDGLCHTINTCYFTNGVQTDFDVQLSVYEGNCANLECIAYNDDKGQCGNAHPGSAEVHFSTEIGTDYYLLVHGKFDDAGNYAMFQHCSDDDVFEINCPDYGVFSCGDPLPEQANSVEEWEALGGEIFSSVCSGGPYTFDVTEQPVGSCQNEGDPSLIRRYDITDESTGETKTCYQYFFCGPLDPIIVTCPADVILGCGEPIPNALTTISELEELGGSAIGGCDLYEDLTVYENYFDCDNDGDVVLERQYIVTDINGNTEACVQQFFCTAIPTLEVICPEDVTVDCFENAPDVALNIIDFMDIGGQVTGGMCSGYGYSASYIFDVHAYSEGDPCEGMTITREYTISAILTGESITCEHQIVIPGLVDPILTPSPPVAIVCFENLDTMQIADFIDVSYPPGVCPNEITAFESMVYPFGNSNCSNDTISTVTRYRFVCGDDVVVFQKFYIENDGVQVTVAPDEVVECRADIEVSPADITISQPCGAYPQIRILNVTIPTQYENCNGQVYTFVYLFEDSCGEEHQYFRRFTIENEGTQVEVAPDQEVECADDIEVSEDDVVITSPCGLSFEAEYDGPTISDPSNPNCSGVTHSYHYYFTDECGDFREYFRTFTIQNKELTLIPEDPDLEGISSGDIISIQCESNAEGWELPQFDASSFDFIAACNLEAEIEFRFEDLGAANCMIDGYAHAYSYTWTVEDECGSKAMFTFELRVVDEIDPVLVGIPADITLECNDEIPLPPTVTATDECECADVFYNEEELSSNICSGNRILLRTWTAKDCCGNEVSQSQTITIEDRTAPELVYDGLHGTELMYSGGTTIECSEIEEVEWLYSLDKNSIIVNETCSENYTVVYTMSGYTPPSCTVAGYKEEWEPTWTVTDDCGNSSTFSFIVRVEDNTAPYLTKSEVMYICPNDTEGYAWVEDGCSNTNSTYEDELIEGCLEGVFMRTYTMEDDCGNITQDEQLVVDLSQRPNLIEFTGEIVEPLFISCSDDFGKLTDFDEKSVQTTAECLPNLEITFYEQMVSNPCVDGKSFVELIWTATTPCGYVDSLIIKAEMVDNKAPVFTNFQDSIVIECSAEMPELTAIDDCSAVEVDYEVVEETWGCANESKVTRIITATDACGNSTTVTQDVYIIDTEGPSINELEHICQSENDEQVEAFDACEGKIIDATLVKAERIECGGHNVVVNTYEAIDACGNITSFVQSVYPDEFDLTYEVSDSRLAALSTERANQINESDFGNYTFLYAMDESSVLAFTPCDDVLMGEFEGTVRINEDCEDGVSRVLTFSWTFMAGCAEGHTYEVVIEVMADDVEEIILEPTEDVYCSDEIPELVILNHHEEFEYNIEETDNRDSNGDGQVIRTVSMIDNCGNESKAEQVINFFATSDLTCNIEGDFNPVCNTSNNIYEVEIVGGTAPYTIEWYANGGDCSIAFVDGTTANINIGFGEANINVTVTDANGCITNCEAVVSCVGMLVGDNDIDSPEGSEEVLEDQANVSDEESEEKFAVMLDVVTVSDFKVFPNPFIETIQLELPKLDEVQKIRVVDGGGRVVYSKNIAPNRVTFTLDLSPLKAGIYFIHNINSHSQTSKKVIKL